MSAKPRYAVYFAPEAGSDLEAFGRAWLGRDAATGETAPLSSLNGAGLRADERARIVAEPRRYGMHATLKPPFALHTDRNEDALLAAVEHFASGRACVNVGPLTLRDLDGFLALMPEPCTGLAKLAFDCVRAFDVFRAPAGEAELARRRAAGLSARQEELLCAWGYPYVDDQFRFHLTLTGRLADELRGRVLRGLEPLVAPLCAPPLRIRELCVFRQPGAGADFALIRRCPLRTG